MRGYLTLVLHAHLPFVCHPELDESLEENWLFEAMTETYIPLLLMFEKLQKDNISFQITMSLSPSLLEMFANPILMYRYTRRLDRLIELSEKEIHRNQNNEHLHVLALWYNNKITQVKDAFLYIFNKNLTHQFKKLQDDGYIEILGSTATHGYLPLLKFDEGAVESQIEIGLNYYQQVFEKKPKGMWLPECGYYPGLEKQLSNHDICFTFLETHGLTRAEPSPKYGVYEPIKTENGVFFFGRDPDSSKLVWSADQGYPADSVYRDFYRDIAYDLDGDSLTPLIQNSDLRFDTGFKYFKITGQTDQKEYYAPLEGERKAKDHAEDFVQKKVAQVSKLFNEMDRNPIIVAPFDAELFGHWWGEGIDWLNSVIRKVSKTPEEITMVTISTYLEGNVNRFSARPALSSWGANGYNKVWLNKENEWIYRYLHHGAKDLGKTIRANPHASGEIKRCLQQAVRELLLAQSSDWAFMIGGKTSSEYAKTRIETHIENVHKILSMTNSGKIEEDWLSMVEGKNPIMSDIDYQTFS